MKILFWNIRGIGNPDSRLVVKSLCSTHKPDILFIAEPMIDFASVPSWFWKSINITKFCVNSRLNNIPNLWGMWSSTFDPLVIFASDQCLVLEFTERNHKFYLAAVYASTSYLHRRQLWSDLSHLQSTHPGPWSFIGDFNAILGAHEKFGRRPPPRASCDDYLNWTNAHSLSHLLTTGVQLTWNNGRAGRDYVAIRLDHTICNMDWFSFWQNISCCALVRSSSNHHPLLFSQYNSTRRHSPPFKFYKIWLEHADCGHLVKDIWHKPVVGSPMACLQQKLKRLKQALKVWNKDTFGNIHDNVSIAIGEVNRIQLLIDSGGISDELMLQDYQAQLVLAKALVQHDGFWREKARSQHFIHGDRNTSYFHRVAQIKASTKQINVIKEAEILHEDPDAIERHILEYFTSIFTSTNNCVANDMVTSCIPSLISQADNDMLCTIPSAIEIKHAVFGMNADGAPGPDGFGGHFYQHFWEVVASNVVLAVQEFFVQGKLLPNMNSNLIVLIPKIPGADRMGDFRPIALANFQFKIITCILADRLASIAPKIITEHQRGFIQGRQISDCVIVASEAINVLHKRGFGGNIALKIDIRKALDTLEWDFLLVVLRQFGFNDVFCDWIIEILRLAKLSILVNGKTVGFFACVRGVRQGDPLSPLLFCLAEEVLSRALLKASDHGNIRSMSYCRGVNVPTHVLYADDIMLFCKGTKANIRFILNIFNRYSEASGQLINKQKSKYYAGNLSHVRRTALASLLGFTAGAIPFNYLGCPIFQGKPKCMHFQAIADRIRVKFATWKGMLLSIMGRVQLVKSAIHGMLVYFFHIYAWPRNSL
jgi:hypothetical protein